MRCVRVLLAKRGRAKYTSHLDMQRCMMRAVRRAGIDLWYTEGFNPKPRLSFATPMSVGLESECEFLDIRIDREFSCAEIMERLNRELTDELLAEGRRPIIWGDMFLYDHGINQENKYHYHCKNHS